VNGNQEIGSMKWHLRQTVLALSVAAVGGLRADEKAVRQELDTTLQRYDTLLQQSFALPFKSPEISALLSQQVAAATQQTLGIPLQVSISHFTYTYTPKGSQIKAHLADLPAAQADLMEKQANQLIQGSAVGQMLETIAFDALKEGVLYLNAQKATCALRKELPATADFSVSGSNQQLLPGLQLKETWFRFDRTAKAVTMLQFNFTNGTSMQARLKYVDMPVAGGASVPVPAQAEITQDAITTPQQGVTVPKKLTVQYGKCVFAAAR
jgi:hypothetical protein